MTMISPHTSSSANIVRIANHLFTTSLFEKKISLEAPVSTGVHKKLDELLAERKVLSFPIVVTKVWVHLDPLRRGVTEHSGV
jgi:hypothetical protein